MIGAKPESIIEKGELVDLQVISELGDLNDNGTRDVTLVANAANPIGTKPLTVTVGPVDVPEKQVGAAIGHLTTLATGLLKALV